MHRECKAQRGTSTELIEVVTPRANAAIITPAENLFAAISLPQPFALEIAATHSEWLFGARAEAAATPMHEIVGSCKTLGFRLARRRAFDVEAAVAPMADAWERAIKALMSAAG